jgi:hypothetical protein
MMLESIAMNRPINNDDIEMFLRSFSYADICQEFSTTTGSTSEHYDNRVNENHPAFCPAEPSNESFQARQHQSSIAEGSKGEFLEICINSLWKLTLFTINWIDPYKSFTNFYKMLIFPLQCFLYKLCENSEIVIAQLSFMLLCLSYHSYENIQISLYSGQ